MAVRLRKFQLTDIDKKIEWINNADNNHYLHYELPLEKEKTIKWFTKNVNRKDRLDLIIEFNGISVGVIGLLDINDREAELYITIGEREYLGKGIAKEAVQQLLEISFKELMLRKIYLVTEIENQAAQHLFDKIGFIRYGIRKKDVLRDGIWRDRYYYEYSKQSYTSIIQLIDCARNDIYIKRDDLIPFSFGGNKARKAFLFFEDIINNHYDYIVTYGTSSSNHCRIIANLAKKYSIPCIIISPSEENKTTYNSKIIHLLSAEVRVVPVENVHDTINETLEYLNNKGYHPYFIEGGGHGNLGTKAMINCYKEIYDFEVQNDMKFDYIFFASGTGTTQAGLVLGKLLYEDIANVIGISIARKLPRGRDIVLQSINDYIKQFGYCFSTDLIRENTIFIDEYTGNQYGCTNSSIKKTIEETFFYYGIPMDATYTGKAFYGMNEYLKKFEIKNKKILFIHTGGTPLFFNELEG